MSQSSSSYEVRVGVSSDGEFVLELRAISWMVPSICHELADPTGH